jgi:uncharacterized protein YdeI (YjbR/CyaY-like superfamily)
MQPTGLKALDEAKNDKWDAAYDSLTNMSVPVDFQVALDESPKAKAFYAALSSRNTDAILFRIQTAKQSKHGKDVFSND